MPKTINFLTGSMDVQKLLVTRIDDSGLPQAFVAYLLRQRAIYIGDLVQLSEDVVSIYCNRSGTAFGVVEAFFHRHELEFEMTVPGWTHEVAVEFERLYFGAPPAPPAVLEIPVRAVGFGPRILRACELEEVVTVGQLAVFPPDQFMRIWGVGRGSYAEVHEKLTLLGVALPGDVALAHRIDRALIARLLADIDDTAEVDGPD